MSTMKLILTQEVTGLGSSGDTVEVKGGYGRNFLLPRGLAIKATRGAEKQVESLRRARATREVRSLEEAQAVAGQLSGLKVRVPARAGMTDETLDLILSRQLVDQDRRARADWIIPSHSLDAAAAAVDSICLDILSRRPHA